MHTFSIYSKNIGISPAFVRANSYIIKKHHDKLAQPSNATSLTCDDITDTNEKKFNSLRNCWLQEFNIIIDSTWTTMTFSSQKSLDLFLLRWS